MAGRVPAPTEQQEHRTLAEWLDLHRLVWFHPPLGGYRRRVEAAIFHGLGSRAGVPDFLIFSPVPRFPDARGVAIELKRRGRDREPDGGVTEDQQHWLTLLEQAGWLTRVCYGAGQAIDWLAELGYGRRHTI